MYSRNARAKLFPVRLDENANTSILRSSGNGVGSDFDVFLHVISRSILSSSAMRPGFRECRTQRQQLPISPFIDPRYF